MEITLGGFREEQVLNRVADMIRETMDERIDAAVRGAIKAELERAVREVVLSKIEPLVSGDDSETAHDTMQAASILADAARVLNARVGGRA